MVHLATEAFSMVEVAYELITDSTGEHPCFIEGPLPVTIVPADLVTS